MKKRNIGICIITTTLLMGGHAKATELILAKDHTNVVNQAAEIAAYKSNRPPVNKRLFTSKAVEAKIGMDVRELFSKYPRNDSPLSHNKWQT